MSHRSRAQSPQETMLCRMATDHGVAGRFYLLVIVFCRSGIFFLPWLLAHLQMPRATFKFLETLWKAKRRLAALFKRTHEVTN